MFSLEYWPVNKKMKKKYSVGPVFNFFSFIGDQEMFKDLIAQRKESGIAAKDWSVSSFSFVFLLAGHTARRLIAVGQAKRKTKRENLRCR